MDEPRPDITSRVDQILDLLLDALLERQMAREARDPQPVAPAVVEPMPPEPSEQTIGTDEGINFAKLRELLTDDSDAPEPTLEPDVAEADNVEERELDYYNDEPSSPPPVPNGQMGRTIFRLALGLLLCVVIVNIPFNRHGVSLARALPDSAALIVRDGLLLKGENSDDIYVLQDDKLRWISSLEAFEDRGYRWRDVHVVAESFLEKFEKGWPVHVLLKCETSPHVYALENGRKRWIKDVPTFAAKGYVWEDVQIVPCAYLRDLPDGLTIPKDAGPPAQP